MDGVAEQGGLETGVVAAGQGVEGCDAAFCDEEFRFLEFDPFSCCEGAERCLQVCDACFAAL